MFFVQIINGIIIGSSYVLIASGLSLIYGILNVVNLAHGEFYMLGAFMSFYLLTVFGLNFWLATLLAMIIVALIGVITEKLIFRPTRSQPLINSMVISITLSVFIMNLARHLFGADSKSVRTAMSDRVVTIAGASFNVQRLLVFISACIIMYLLYIMIEKTKIGKAMRACAENHSAAQLMGINLDKIFSLTFAIGCALAAAAGALMAPIFFTHPAMGMLPLMKAFGVVIMGGLGNVYGAVFSGIILGVTESMTAAYISPALKDAVAFILIIIVLLFKPNGLFGRR